MAFDVIVVHYRTWDTLVRCLSSLEKWEPEHLGQVFVIDNSVQRAPDSFPLDDFSRATWIANTRNIGFAGAVNQILDRCSSSSVCILNPDAWIEGPLWSPLAAWLNDNPTVGIVGPRILEKSGSVQGSARSFPSIHTAFFGRTSLMTRLHPDNLLSRKQILARSEDARAGSEPVDVDWVSGACLVARRSAIEAVGPMDSSFFLYWEDCDWCTRFLRTGWRVVYHPGMGPVRHLTGCSSQQVPWLSLYHFHRSAVRLYRKYDRSPAKTGSLLALLGAALRTAVLGFGLLVRGRSSARS